MNQSLRIEKILEEFYDLKIESKKSLKSMNNIKEMGNLQCSLSDLFYSNTDVKESEKITRIILESLKYNKPDYIQFLKGISKHLKNPISPLYEHAVILTASIFRDSSFNFNGFTQLDKFKDLMPEECFKKKPVVNLKTKFDDKIKIMNDCKLFTRRKPINYLQEGIQIIKDENHERIDEVFNKLPNLILRSSNRVIQAKCREYLYILLNYDGYDLIKSDVLYSLVNRAFDKLYMEVINLIFGDSICLRFKLCLTNVLVKIVENEKDDYYKIRQVLLMLVEKINEKDQKTNDFILYNLKYILEICELRLK